MNDNNIFEENVMIPDIVNAKVDQVLSALPDHGTIREVNPKKKVNSRKTVTRVLAFTAAASVLLLSYTVYRTVNPGKEKASEESLISESTDRQEGTITQTYTIMVAGQGLRNDTSIPLENTTSEFTGLSMFYYDVEFECEFPLSVVGENVESVEYSFKNAEVAIVHNGTSPENITGEKIDLDERYLSDWKDETNRYYIGHGQFGIGTVDFYHEYKETAPSEYGENHTKYLCVLTKDRKDLYEHTVLEDQDGRFGHSCDFLTAMCKDIVVTIKVNFKDGSSEVTDIGIKGTEVPYSYQDDEGNVYNEMAPGFACYIKGSSEEPGEIHLRSFEEEGFDQEPFTDEELALVHEPEPDAEVVQEQERLRKLVEEKNILNAPDLPVSPQTYENGNGGIGRIGWDQGWCWVSFGFPFIVDGENVDHVEYRSACEGLCFYVHYRVGDEEYRIEGAESSIGSGRNDAAFAEDPEHPKKGEQVYHCYSSFSMKYPVQEMQNYELYVDYDVRGIEELKSKDTDLYTMKGYEDSDFYNTALKDAAIEMTVYFRDGTSVTKKIGFALILEDEEGSRYSNRNLYAYIIE